jgi:hypothetical protein
VPRKLTAVFHTTRVIKRDESYYEADLEELLAVDGQPLEEVDPDLNDQLWDEQAPGELVLATDPPDAFGPTDTQFEVFGRVLTREDFQTGEYLVHGDGKTDYEVEVLRLEFEVDDEGRVLPVSELVLTKLEENPHHEYATAVFAYFLGTPTPDALLLAFHQRYPRTAPEEAGYHPQQFQDAVADRAQLQRWFLAQAT